MDVAAGEEDFALGGLDHADDHLDGGRLARAVGAEITKHFAFFEGEADVPDGGNAAIAFGDVIDLEHGLTLCSILLVIAYYIAYEHASSLA